MSNDYAERARQLAQRIAEIHPPVNGSWDAESCPAWISAITKLATEFASTVATETRAATIEEGIAIAKARIEDVPDHVDVEKDENQFAAGYLMAAGSIKSALERLSSNSDFLTKLRDEARAKAFENAIDIVSQSLDAHDAIAKLKEQISDGD